jgi:RNA polymerase sigma-70 factor, ECF subfamily
MDLSGAARRTSEGDIPNGTAPRPAFDAVYEDNFGYIWRAARRLGVETRDIDDVVQEVFVVAHRRLAEFEGRSQVRTWLFKILVRVVRHHLRTQRRKPANWAGVTVGELETVSDGTATGPVESLERAEAARVLDEILAQLSTDKREVFVLAEIEQLSAVEIAEILATNINTIYSRLRSARAEFESALRKFHQRQQGRTP